MQLIIKRLSLNLLRVLVMAALFFAPFGAGAALASDAGNYIYALRGNNTVTFWRYSVSADSWAAMADTPVTPCVTGGVAVRLRKRA